MHDFCMQLCCKSLLGHYHFFNIKLIVGRQTMANLTYGTLFCMGNLGVGVGVGGYATDLWRNRNGSGRLDNTHVWPQGSVLDRIQVFCLFLRAAGLLKRASQSSPFPLPRASSTPSPSLWPCGQRTSRTSPGRQCRHISPQTPGIPVRVGVNRLVRAGMTSRGPKFHIPAHMLSYIYIYITL